MNILTEIFLEVEEFDKKMSNLRGSAHPPRGGGSK
jgi:hypothetical protein